VFKPLSLCALALCAAFSLATPASAAVGIVIGIAPPPPFIIETPAPRPGYVWNGGYWNWTNHRHVWVKGNWIRERKGYVYQPNRWVNQDGRWQLERGRWGRNDMDHDGIPNRKDHDRDGDGIRNRQDRHPNQPGKP
jgi:hypothetical protein